MKNNLTTSKEISLLPVHSLDDNSRQINILPLDHNNPYDFKRHHRHTYYEVMIINRGGCNQLIDFKEYKGFDNSVYVVCPQQVHLMNRNQASGTIIQFSEDRIQTPELRTELKNLSFYDNSAIVFENRPDLVEEFQSVVHLIHSQIQKNNSTSNLVVTNLLQVLVALILEYSGNRENYSISKEKKLLLDFYDLLEAHFNDNVGVQFFIDRLQTSEKKFASTVKSLTGMNPLQIIHNRIILESKRLLLFEEVSQKEIAFQLGFESQQAFSAFIKSKTGLSPTELTKKLAEIHK